jgi:hypothetical protein
MVPSGSAADKAHAPALCGRSERVCTSNQEGLALPERGNAQAKGLSVPSVEVAGIEPVRTIGNRWFAAQPVGSRRNRSDSVGSDR